jgi:hypothetical protein
MVESSEKPSREASRERTNDELATVTGREVEGGQQMNKRLREQGERGGEDLAEQQRA